MTRVAEPSSARQRLSFASSPERHAPPPGSDTHRFTTRRGNEEYRGKCSNENFSVRSQRTKEQTDPRSQSRDLDNGVDRSVQLRSRIVHEAREANKAASAQE